MEFLRNILMLPCPASPSKYVSMTDLSLGPNDVPSIASVWGTAVAPQAAHSASQM